MSDAPAMSGAGASNGIRDEGQGVLAYLERSHRPLVALAFVLPLLVIYETGVQYQSGDGVRPPQHIVAFTLVQQFFGMFGITGQHLPAFAVIGILIVQHLRHKDSIRLDLSTLVVMAAESVALAFPLLTLGYVLNHYLLHSLPDTAMALSAGQTTNMLILSVGAGVYEEALFRLVLCTVLTLIVKHVFEVRGALASLLIVVTSAVLFAGYHYLGPEAFTWRTFIFRSIAGAYFASLLLARGFGITCGSHAAYDMVVVLL